MKRMPVSRFDSALASESARRLHTHGFPKEIISPPREWVERVFNVARWTEMPVGGHFAALEQPRALATDIHEAFWTINQPS